MLRPFGHHVAWYVAWSLILVKLSCSLSGVELVAKIWPPCNNIAFAHAQKDFNYSVRSDCCRYFNSLLGEGVPVRCVQWTPSPRVHGTQRRAWKQVNLILQWRVASLCWWLFTVHSYGCRRDFGKYSSPIALVSVLCVALLIGNPPTCTVPLVNMATAARIKVTNAKIEVDRRREQQIVWPVWGMSKLFVGCNLKGILRERQDKMKRLRGEMEAELVVMEAEFGGDGSGVWWWWKRSLVVMEAEFGGDGSGVWWWWKRSWWWWKRSLVVMEAEFGGDGSGV